MNTIFDLAETEERTWGTLATAIDENFAEASEFHTEQDARINDLENEIIRVDNKVDALTVGVQEKVSIKLSSEDGFADVAYKIVTVTVEGEGTPRQVQTSATGTASVSIPHGLTYTIEAPAAEGYKTPNAVSFYAIFANRDVNLHYLLSSEKVETCTIQLKYGDSSKGTASSVLVVRSDREMAESVNVVSNKVTLTIPWGVTYTIKFPDIAGTKTPATRTFKAGHYERGLSVLYIASVSGVYWILNDGTEVVADEITKEQDAEIFGLLVIDSTLSTNDCQFIIPIAVLKGARLGGGFGTAESVLTAYSPPHNDINGLSNTQKRIDAGDNSGTIYSNAIAKTLTLNGVERSCFVPAFGQLYRFGVNFNALNSITSEILGWSIQPFTRVSVSTRYSDTNLYLWFTCNSSGAGVILSERKYGYSGNVAYVYPYIY